MESPAWEIFNDRSVSYEVERVEGNLLYVKGHKYPFKGLPTLERVQTAGIFKGLLKFRAQAILEALEYILEHDQAYRFRFMDMLAETTKERLTENPRREIKRLLAINKARDYTHANGPLVSDKIGKVGNLVLWALLLPPLKRRFREAIATLDWSKYQWDDIDRYWAYLKNDYDYFGLSFEKRQILLKAMLDGMVG